MAKQCYFEQMISQYGENWTIGVTPDGIQKSSKRIFKEMSKGQIDYEKYGQNFLDAKVIDNLIIASQNELEINTLLYNAVVFYSNSFPQYPNIGAEITHLQSLCYIYNIFFNKLRLVKETGNIGNLADIAALLYNVRNHLQ